MIKGRGACPAFFLSSKMKVALASFMFSKNLDENVEKVRTLTMEAAEKSAEMVCFPECALTGLPTEDYEVDRTLATEIPGHLADRLGAIARKFRIYMAIGLLERDDGRLYDTAVLFDRDGDILLKYRRISSGWHSRNVPATLYCEGDSFETAEIQGIRFGFLICGDLFEPEAFRLAQEARPDVLIVPLSRSFEHGEYDVERWNREEKWVYARQVAKVGITSLLINALEPKEFGGSFGGLMVIDSDGEILAETLIGRPNLLIYKLDFAEKRLIITPIPIYKSS